MKCFVRLSVVIALCMIFTTRGEAGPSPRLLEDMSHTPATDVTLLAAAERSAGKIRAVVRTAVAFAPESLLGAWEKTVQRREIAAAAAALRKAMPRAEGFTALPGMPYVMMTVDEAGLARLATISGVSKIVPEEGFNWMRDFMQLRSAGNTEAGSPMRRSGVPAVAPRMAGSIDANPGTHPFQVALLNKRIKSNSRAQFCGGTLVSPYHVVTSAQCSDFIVNPRTEVQVLAGTQSLLRGGRRAGVERIDIHSGWDTETLNNDVAVWTLAEPVLGISVATLASSQPTTPGTPLRVTGWGSQIADFPPPGSSTRRPTTLQQADVAYMPAVSGQCSYRTGITPQMLCAVYEPRPPCVEGVGGVMVCEAAPFPGDSPSFASGPCDGDTGGPLTIDRGAGYTELVGIISIRGEPCGLPNYPYVYANVAESGINRFIRGIVDAPFVLPTLEFETASYQVSEAARRIIVTVKRSQTAGTASVNLKTSPGTAFTKADFRAVTRKLTFKPGVASVSVPITVVNDRLAERTESFTVSLSDPSFAFSLGDTSTATVTINDND